jgi:hypothetical protein
MSQITMAEWGQLRTQGATTYAVGPVPGKCSVFTGRTEAEQAAAEGDGTFIQWDGTTGHQVTVPDVEMEAG